MRRQTVHYTKSDLPAKYGPLPTIKAHLGCVTGAGVYPEPPRPDVDALTQSISTWASEMGFPTNTRNAAYEPVDVSGTIVSIYLGPSLGRGSPQALAFAKLLAFVFLTDDCMDELSEEHVDREENVYNNVSADLVELARLLEVGTSGAAASKQRSSLPHYDVLARAAADMGDSFGAAVDEYSKHNTHFVAAFSDWLHSFLWRFRRDLVSDPETVESYLFFRRHQLSSYCWFEILPLLHGLRWDSLQASRGDIEFRRWRQAYANCMTLTNDVLSLRKELGDGETENLAIIKHLVDGISIEQAAAEVVTHVNCEVREVRVYSSRLVSRYPSDEGLAAAVEVLNTSIDGHLFFYAATQRYGHMDRDIREMDEEEYQASVRVRRPVTKE